MRVCATYGSVPGERSDAPMEEFRLDVFDELPGDIGRDDIIALCGRDASLVPEGFEGLVDAGESEGASPSAGSARCTTSRERRRRTR